MTPHHFLIVHIGDVLNVNAKRMKLLLRNFHRCLNHVFLLEQLKSYQGGKSLTQKQSRGPATWKGMLKNASRDTASWQTKKWSSCTKFQVLAWMITNSRRKNLNHSENYEKYAHKLSCNAWIWHGLVDQTFYGLFSYLQELFQNDSGLGQRRSAILISKIHHTDDCRQYCHVGKPAQHCRLGLFQDSDFAGDLEDSKSASEEVLCIFGRRTIVSIGWMCKKQTSVSHSSAESVIISVDAALRMDGQLALDFWNAFIEVSRSTNNTKRPIELVPGNWCGTGDHSRNKTKTKTPTGLVSGNRDGERSNRDVEQLSNVDYVPKHTFFSRRVSVVHLRRQWGSDQDDHQRTKSNNETRVQNPHCCSWVVVR